MNKKVIMVVSIILILTPVSTALSINQKIQSQKEIEKSEIQKDIESLLNKVNKSIISNYLEKFVSFGFKMTGSENAHKAAVWIKSEFETLGYHTYFDNWKFPRYKDKNVIAIHNGTDLKSDAVILISAHYDTINGSPGANDDGSGIAAMLTIANLTKNINFNHTIRFIANSGEEVGTYGSFADAKKAYCRKENIIAVLNIDMIGYANESDEHLMQIFSQERSKWIAEYSEEIADKYKNCFNLNPVYTNQYPADHECYNDLGYDGVQYIQYKPEEATWFHTPGDTLDKITYPYLINITKLVLAVACELADRPIHVQVQITRPKEAYVYLFDIPIIKLPCYNLYFSKSRAITYIIGKTTVELNITTDEKISSVYFGIDGYLRHFVKEPPYEWKIGTELYKFFPLYGYHRITICVTTETGKTATDEMDILVLTQIN